MDYHLEFFTATIKDWLPVLRKDQAKDIIMNSLGYLVKKKRITLFGFVIMNNHIHLIWKISQTEIRSNLQRDFLKFTGQQLKFYLKDNNPELLDDLKVDSSDRKYQIWQRNPLTIELATNTITEQKLNYIHENPCKKGYCNSPEEYKYSSARFYARNSDDFNFLSYYMDE